MTVSHPVDSVSDLSYTPAPLPVGTALNQYVIEELLAQSFSGYTYRAMEPDTGRQLVIQEYFPVEISVRDLDSVALLLREEGVSNEFELGLMRFMKLARALSNYSGKGRVISVFELNDTAYYVTEFEVHSTLKMLIENQHRIPDEAMRKWLSTCLNFLLLPHRANQLHLGLQSDSILVDNSGEILLTGFNSVGPSFNIEPHKEEYLYLPIERIKSTAEMRPSSDLYSLAAVIFQAMTGEIPPHAARRIGAVAAGKRDPLLEFIPGLKEEYSAELVKTLGWMLAPQPEDRPKSVEDVLRALATGVIGQPEQIREEPKPQAPPVKRSATQQRLEPSLGNLQAEQRPGSPSENHPVDQNQTTDGDPQLWFAESESSGSANNAPRLSSVIRMTISHPAAWLVGIVAALMFAYFWLGDDQQPGISSDPVAVAPSINVLDSGANQSLLPQPNPEIVPEPELKLTESSDNQQLQTFQKLDSLERKLRPHFMEADTHFASNRLTTPQGSNALESYRTVLSLDPENQRAQQGITAIVDKLVGFANDAVVAKDQAKANEYIDKVELINPDRVEIASVREQIALQLLEIQRAEEAAQRAAEEKRQRELAEQELQQNMQRLLSRAITSYEAGRLVEPPANNALFFYREILKVNGENVAALTGIAQIAATFVRQSKQALAEGNFELADRNLTTAAVVDPNNAELPNLRDQINTRRQLAEQEKQALAEMERQKREAELAAQTQEQLNLQSGISAYYLGNYTESYSFLKLLADRGNSRAKFRVAMMLQNGRGVAANRAEARRLFLDALEPIQQAARNGQAWAQADLGSYFEDGIIMQRNYAEAARWYFLAADQGYAGAQTNLGVLFANGHGVQGDMDSAVEWFKRAAIQGDNVAKENLRILGYNPDRITLGTAN